MLRLNILIVALILFAGCGLKTSLVVYDDSAPLPEISRLSYQVAGNEFHMNLDIQGGSGLVLYQLDRAEVAPDCKCIGNWFRYYESTASTQRQGLERRLKLRKTNVVYAFRLRIKDNLGRVSVWSKVFKSKVESDNE